MEKPKFKVSYRGEAEYLLDGFLYRVRSFSSDDGHYNKMEDGSNYYDIGIEPFVGTVSYAHDDGADHFHEFPPAEVIAIFAEEHPSIVGARYVPGSWRSVEYTAPRGIAKCGPNYWGKDETAALFHIEEMRKYFPDSYPDIIC